MSAKIDFTCCEHWHKCLQVHRDLEELKGKHNEASIKRDSMEETLGKIEEHLAVSNEKFKWLERAGWGIGTVIVILVGYMITLSIVNFKDDAELRQKDAVQIEKLKSISTNIEDIKGILKDE